MGSRYRSLDLLIIDEVGMVNCFIFSFLNKRRQFIRRSSEPFGGVSVVIIFYPLQLPCIKSVPLWADERDISSELGKDGLGVFRLFEMVSLTENVRRKGCDQFQVLLDNFRYKKVTKADIDLLSKRLSKRSVTEIENLKVFCKSLWCERRV
jgi:hypothetical protein